MSLHVFLPILIGCQGFLLKLENLAWLPLRPEWIVHTSPYAPTDLSCFNFCALDIYILKSKHPEIA